ncbi:MAG TPA: PilZ domain-containing protein [Hyphomicrobiaceae bacterium]|nr:PilZ domain-containing protein [Hyphomicrobiaceae bacterium]
MTAPAANVVHLSTLGALAQKAPDDLRMAPRRRMLKAGVVAYNDRHVTIPCLVRDMSSTGARLRIDTSVTAPDTFELIIDLDGMEANCQVVWRKGTELGVKFLAAPRTVAAKRVQVINALVPTQAPSLRRKPRPGETV